MIHGIQKDLSVNDVDVDVMSAICEISIEKIIEVHLLLVFGLTEGSRQNGEGIGDTIFTIIVLQVGYRSHGSHRAGSVTAVHRVGTRSKGFAGLSSIRCGTGLLTIYDIGCNGQDRLGRAGISVALMLTELLHELSDHFCCDTVDLRVIITVLRIVAGDLEIHCQAHLVSDRLYLRVLDGGQAVGDDRKTGKTTCHSTVDLLIVKRHLKTLIAVLVMHIVNDIQGVDIKLTEPCACLIETRHNFIVVEVLGCDRVSDRSDLISGLLITSAVNSIQQALGKICTCTEELHLLTDTHRRNTACDGVVITELLTHKLIAFILDGAGVDGDLCTVLLEILRKIRAPKDRHVRLRCRSDILQSMEETVAHLRNHVASVKTDTADTLSDPCRVAGEELVVSRSSKEAHDTKLHDEVVDDFLDLRLGHGAVFEFFFCINIEESGHTSQGHGRTVLFFYHTEITEVQPLYRLGEISCCAGDVKAIALRHLRQLIKALDLLGDLFSLLDRLHVHDIRQDLILRLSLLGDQESRSVKRDTAVVADDTSSAVGVRKTGQDTAVTGTLHLRCVSIENAVVMCLSILEDLFHFRIHLAAICLQR